MRFPRFIPKQTFQAAALTSLVTWIALVIYWVTTETGLYRQLALRFGWYPKYPLMLLTFLVMFVIWIGVIILIRKFSTIPTMKEELGAGLEDGLPAVIAAFKRSFIIQYVKNEEMYRAEEYTKELRVRARQIGLGFIIIGVMLLLAGIWMLAITAETGFLSLKAQVFLFIFGLPFLIVGLIQVVTGKSVMRK